MQNKLGESLANPPLYAWPLGLWSNQRHGGVKGTSAGSTTATREARNWMTLWSCRQEQLSPGLQRGDEDAAVK